MHIVINMDYGAQKLIKNVLKIITIILLISTFFVIFRFSNHDGDKSKSISKTASEKIVEIYSKNKNLTLKEKNQLVEKMNPIIRKLAHFLIYMLVGILIFSFINLYQLIFLKKFVISILIGLIYAISDEIHQIFVPGRTARVTDVLIDTFGVFIGIMIVNLAIYIYKRKKFKED